MMDKLVTEISSFNFFKKDQLLYLSFSNVEQLPISPPSQRIIKIIRG